MRILGFEITKSSALAAAQSLALSATDRAVVVLKQSNLGTVVANNIRIVAGRELSGREKFEQVVSQTVPLIVSYASSGGVRAAATDVEDLARALVQSVYNDAQSSTAGRVASAILKFFGRKLG